MLPNLKVQLSETPIFGIQIKTKQSPSRHNSSNYKPSNFDSILGDNIVAESYQIKEVNPNNEYENEEESKVALPKLINLKHSLNSYKRNNMSFKKSARRMLSFN